ncbi:Clp protease N-terminal domain-containing protein [Rhodococcus opacus]
MPGTPSSWTPKQRRAHHHDHLGTEHLLLGILREADGIAAKTLQSWRISADVVDGRPPVRGYSARSHPWTSPSCADTFFGRSRSIAEHQARRGGPRSPPSN